MCWRVPAPASVPTPNAEVPVHTISIGTPNSFLVRAFSQVGVVYTLDSSTLDRLRITDRPLSMRTSVAAHQPAH
jgi:hypothetical protein